MLDAILSPEWEFRYYSFNSKWAEGEMMASCETAPETNGTPAVARGIGLIGLAHESPMYRMDSPWPGIFDSVLQLSLTWLLSLRSSRRTHRSAFGVHLRTSSGRSAPSNTRRQMIRMF